ncbi:MAG: quinate 5-dehydrogenase [Trueperaceae bacterium]
MTSSPHDSERPLRVVSVSTGSSRRDATVELELLGRRVRLERRGTDGDLRAAAHSYEELADHVDAFGMGGTDLRLHVAGRSYTFRESARLARHAGATPVVCGAGLKATLEPRAVELLDAAIGWADRRMLVTSAVDRWGMAEALHAHGAKLVLGDLAFLLGVPILPRELATMARTAQVLAPLVTRLPMAWIYPTGTKQDAPAATSWRSRRIADADGVAGDFHLLARFAPPDLSGKIVLTNTTTAGDLRDLAARGVRYVATTTPRIDGRSLPTNLLEAAFVAVAGRERHPLPLSDLAAMVAEAGLAPDLWGRAPDGTLVRTDPADAGGTPTRPG